MVPGPVKSQTKPCKHGHMHTDRGQTDKLRHDIQSMVQKATREQDFPDWKLNNIDSKKESAIPAQLSEATTSTKEVGVWG